MSKTTHCFGCFATLAMFAVAMAFAGAAHADSARYASAVATMEDKETITIELGRSVLLETEFPVARVSVTKPSIADVEVLSPNQLLVMGESVGLTDLLLWDEDDRAEHRDIRVVIDLDYLNQELARVFPESQLRVVQSRDVLIVAGSLRRSEDAALLRQFLESYEIKHVDMTRVEGVHQVLIEVKVAEVSRTALRALDIEAFFAGDKYFGSVQPSGFNPANIGVPGGAPVQRGLPFEFLSDAGATSAATLFLGFPRADLQVVMRALEENRYLRILAEPNLVALSGEEASFLAGGEFPIPVVQSGSGNQSITIEFREFGVGLNFAPHVLGENMIRLHVAPEVTDLSDIGSVEIEGFRIPGVQTRRASTTLELRSGQSFGMAGLLNQRSEARNTKIPLLGDLPVLGPLFRSVRYERGETELVVLVTASLVEPHTLATTPPLPGTLHVTPNDWELFAKGQIEGEPPPLLAPADQKHLRELGLDRLKGPGTWVEYGTPPAEARPAYDAPGPPSDDEEEQQVEEVEPISETGESM